MTSMQAVVLDNAGPPETFRMTNLPIPEAKDTEVVIKQTFAAINFGDVIRRRRGLFPPNISPPYILGFEGVGVVSAVGRGVDGISIGERVAYLAERGGYAQYVSVPAAQVWRVPPSVSDEGAAGITCAGLTAWGLISQCGIRSSDTALIHGAAGGVGSIIVQLLNSQGVKVIAVVSGAQKRRAIEALGVETVIDRADSDIDSVINAVGRNSINAIFDCVGQDALDLNLAVIKPGGTWMYYGSTSGHASFPGDRVLMHRLNIRGFVVFELARDTTAWHQGTTFLASALAAGIVKTQTTTILPLGEAHEGHRLLESRAVVGKIVLRMH